MYDVGIIGGKIWQDGTMVQKNLYINSDHIVAYHDQKMPAREKYLATGCYVLPGMIDPHVHFELNLGKWVSADGFYTGSLSAAFGGVTTYIDFLDPVSRTNEIRPALIKRMQEAKVSMVDYRFHATFTEPLDDVEEMVQEAKAYGLCGIKVFTTYKESGRMISRESLKNLLVAAHKHQMLVLVHCELDELILRNEEAGVADLPSLRPEEAEIQAVRMVADLVRNTGASVYLVHISSAHTLAMLKEEYGDLLGKTILIESCPHYFYHDETRLLEEAYAFVCAPPLRSKKSVDSMTAYGDQINTIGTDHCSFMAESRQGAKLQDMPFGVGSIEHSFVLMYQKFGLKAVELMSVNPAKIFGLYPQKGSLKIGTDADVCIFDPNVTRVIGKDHSASDMNIYEHVTVNGCVKATLLGGQFVVKDEALILGSVGHRIRR